MLQIIHQTSKRSRIVALFPFASVHNYFFTIMSTSTPEFISSNKGGRKLLLQGFANVKKKSSNYHHSGSVYWEDTERSANRLFGHSETLLSDILWTNTHTNLISICSNLIELKQHQRKGFKHSVRVVNTATLIQRPRWSHGRLCCEKGKNQQHKKKNPSSTSTLSAATTDTRHSRHCGTKWVHACKEGCRVSPGRRHSWRNQQAFSCFCDQRQPGDAGRKSSLVCRWHFQEMPGKLSSNLHHSLLCQRHHFSVRVRFVTWQEARNALRTLDKLESRS